MGSSEEKRVPVVYAIFIQHMYVEPKTSANSLCGEPENVTVKVDVRQGLALSPKLFVPMLWCIMITDNLVSVVHS